MGNYPVILKVIIGVSILILSLSAYIKIAKKTNFTTQLINSKNRAIVGAGILFPLSYIYSLFFFETLSASILITVLLLMLVSFIDDIKPISITLRLSAQVICVSLVLFSLNKNSIEQVSILSICCLFLVYISYINAFNFMDGVNGMLASHTLITVCALLVINSINPFVNSLTLGLLLFAALIFLIGNFRQRPLFISGDVGSITLGFIVGFFIIKFYMLERNPMIFSLMLIYLIDTGTTLCINMINRKNIFKQHREHLYEKLVFKNRTSDLKISSIYSLVQISISLFVIYNIYYQKGSTLSFFVFTILLVIIYIIFRGIIFKNEFRKTSN